MLMPRYAPALEAAQHTDPETEYTPGTNGEIRVGLSPLCMSPVSISSTSQVRYAPGPLAIVWSAVLRSTTTGTLICPGPTELGASAGLG